MRNLSDYIQPIFEGDQEPIRITLDIEGYYNEDKLAEIDKASGIYFVYAAKKNPQTDKYKIRLLYIGKTTNLDNRPEYHNKKEDFEKELKPGEILLYSFAKAGKIHLNKIENALIFTQQPPLNETSNKSYQYRPIILTLKGRVVCIKEGEWETDDNNKIQIKKN